MTSITLYLGLDVHKDSITIAIAEPGPKGEIRLFGTILNSVQAVERALTRIREAHPGAKLEVAYEAGPCGFVIARRLKQLQVPCLVAAPSLIPKQCLSPPTRLFAIFVALAPMLLRTCAAVDFGSRPSCSATATVTRARPIGVSRTCVTCANWCWLIRL